jgi:hypothetical protein
MMMTMKKGKGKIMGDGRLVVPRCVVVAIPTNDGSERGTTCTRNKAKYYSASGTVSPPY